MSRRLSELVRRGLRPALVRRTPPTRPDPAQNDPHRIYLPLRLGQAVLDETPKAITPFGGLASFITFLGQIGYAQAGAATAALCRSRLPTMPSRWLTPSPRSHVGGGSGRRFAHCQWLRADRVLHALLGVERFPGDDTIRNFFLRFTQAHIEAFWRPLWRWLLRLLACPKAGFSLDLDSTVFCREGQQEGAAKGFNPAPPGAQQSSSAAGGAGRGAVHPARLAAQREHRGGARGRARSCRRRWRCCRKEPWIRTRAGRQRFL